MSFSFTHIISRFGSGITSSFRRHSGFVLFVVCALVVGLWGWIFWRYVYSTEGVQPQVTVQPLNVKSADLNSFLSDIKARADVSGQVMSKTFPDPFLKPPGSQP